MYQKDSSKELTVVVPIYNEEHAFQTYLNELVDYCKKGSWKLIFVNDGSSDASGKILDQINKPFVKVIHHKLNRGYGGALKTGILNADTQYVITFDGDGQHKVDDIIAILDYMKTNHAEMVIGSRKKSGNENAFRETGKGIIRFIARLLIPFKIKDLNSGFKIYQTDLAQQYQSLCPDTMAFSDVITLIFIKQRKLVLEFPITVVPRRSGKSTINIHTAVDTITEILNLIMLLNPLKVFLPLSAICLVFGIAWGIPLLINGKGVSVGALLGIISGLFFFFMGLIAHQLSQIRMDMAENYRK
jgi:glycosyltransferase involved in cell wall biosynthesis